MAFLRPFMSKKFKAKIVQIHDWRRLTTYISEHAIDIPEDSRHFVARAFRAMKVNSRGKKQMRLVKFTTTSLLNIDPRSRKVRTETRLSDIVAVATISLRPLELYFRFHPNSTDASVSRYKNSIFDRFKSSVADSLNRRYIFQTREARDETIAALYQASVTSELMLCNDFQVEVGVDSGATGRALKLTNDSILVLNDAVIEAEYSFGSITAMSLGTADCNSVSIAFRDEVTQHWWCRRAAKLFEVLTYVREQCNNRPSSVSFV